MSVSTEHSQTMYRRQVLGMPVALLWGFVAVACFMVGDGIEQAFLSKYIVQLGFTLTQSALVFTVYGITVAVAAWLSGVFADTWGPRRTMVIGFIIWVIFDVGFLTLGLSTKNYPMMLVMYGLRGFGYPLFCYGFIVWIAYVSPKHKLSSAMGWFWFMYSIGIGVIGSYLPSFTIPHIGFLGTLWIAVGWILVGGLMGVFLIRDKFDIKETDLPLKEKVRELLSGILIVKERPRIITAGIVKIINQLSMYGLPIIFPIYFTSKIGFTTSQWLQIWGDMFLVNMFMNVVWGFIGDKIGWHRQVMWFGCVGTAVTTLLFYYVPLFAGKDYWLTVFVAILYGVSLAAFVPMSAIIPSIAPDRKGAAMSIHNLASGISNFAAPAIVAGLLPFFNIQGVVWTFAVIYVIGAVLSYFLKVDQKAVSEDSPEMRTDSAVSYNN
ncbi:MFS transporter [Alicyclobacillus fastidiosus]|uniref:MFS transporter n=1 Tax=Alicyclobacillus fastidiosus TaxID=392011 RepID=A0ABV5ABB5_9BACL|nr:MFS transporter [Alicyclobacillus fastidiosus]WEH10467.1 MFS transporter [Alicyclobacillus fastidiosus]